MSTHRPFQFYSTYLNYTIYSLYSLLPMPQRRRPDSPPCYSTTDSEQDDYPTHPLVETEAEHDVEFENPQSPKSPSLSAYPGEPRTPSGEYQTEIRTPPRTIPDTPPPSSPLRTVLEPPTLHIQPISNTAPTATRVPPSTNNPRPTIQILPRAEDLSLARYEASVIRKSKPKPKAIICKRCDHTFFSRAQYSRHVAGKQHQKALKRLKEPITCKPCQQTFFSLHDHQFHINGRKHRCTLQAIAAQNSKN